MLMISDSVRTPSLSVLCTQASQALSNALLKVVRSAARVVPRHIGAPRKDKCMSLLTYEPGSARFSVSTSTFTLQYSLRPVVVRGTTGQVMSFTMRGGCSTLLVSRESKLSPIALP